MLIKQLLIRGTNLRKLEELSFEADLIFVFSSKKFKELSLVLQSLREEQPNAIITGCTTAGQIYRDRVYDNSVSITAIKFEKTKLVRKMIHIPDIGDSYKAGQHLADKFKVKGLQHLVVLSDGLNVNADEFLNGLSHKFSNKVTISGGLAGDGEQFNQTFIIDDQIGLKNTISAIGFYGKNLEVNCSSSHGWQPFGINRTVTKSKNNIIYEIDGKPALEIIKSFLGEEKDNLPASALLVPICMEKFEEDSYHIRSIVGVDKGHQSLIFAGNVVQGSVIRLMKTKSRDLESAAKKAARRVNEFSKRKPDFALVVGNVGRKMIHKQMTDIEIEAVQNVFGKDTVLTGFYGYGEFMSSFKNGPCLLYNQSLTLTTFKEY